MSSQEGQRRTEKDSFQIFPTPLLPVFTNIILASPQSGLFAFCSYVQDFQFYVGCALTIFFFLMTAVPNPGFDLTFILKAELKSILPYEDFSVKYSLLSLNSINLNHSMNR